LTHSDFGKNIYAETHNLERRRSASKKMAGGAESNYRPGGGGVDFILEHQK